jgi:hypothetical protein
MLAQRHPADGFAGEATGKFNLTNEANGSNAARRN